VSLPLIVSARIALWLPSAAKGSKPGIEAKNSCFVLDGVYVDIVESVALIVNYSSYCFPEIHMRMVPDLIRKSVRQDNFRPDVSENLETPREL
jgi:hypothetical protein